MSNFPAEVPIRWSTSETTTSTVPPVLLRPHGGTHAEESHRPVGPSQRCSAGMLEHVIVGQLHPGFDVLGGEDAHPDLPRGRVMPLLRLAVGRAGGVDEARQRPPAATFRQRQEDPVTMPRVDASYPWAAPDSKEWPRR